MAYRLFDLPGLPADEPDPPGESRGRRITRLNRFLIEAGFNPATHRALLRNEAPGCELRCKDCVHAFPTGRSRRTYWKCAKNLRGVTMVLLTDIRIKWPAFKLFELRVNA